MDSAPRHAVANELSQVVSNKVMCDGFYSSKSLPWSVKLCLANGSRFLFYECHVVVDGWVTLRTSVAPRIFPLIA